MFSKYITKTFGFYQPQKYFSSRVLSYESLEALQKEVDGKIQPVFSCYFFTAAWNPQCEEAEKGFENIAAKFPDYTFIKVDTDKDVRAARYFGAKYEPEFAICAQGVCMKRHYGLYWNELETILNRVPKIYAETEFFDNTNVYEPFNAKFLEDYKENDYLYDYLHK